MFKPTDLPATRAALIGFFAQHGEMLFRQAIDSGNQDIRPHFGDAEDAAELARGELSRLRDAELFWVSEGMTDLAEVAAETLPGFSLQPEDLPAPSGLLVFDRPVGEVRTVEYGGTEEVGYIRGASWGPTPPGLPDGVWVSWYTDSYLNVEQASTEWLAHMFGVPLHRAESLLPELRARARRNMPALSYDNESLMLFGQGERGAVSFKGKPLEPGESPYPLELLRTTWMLMQQPIAKADNAAFDRASRRRMQRARVEPATVRIINLRRPSGSSTNGESDREYHHRWIVRGHWRQQWYPGRKVHRPVWIAPHIKGPEDAPFIGGEKVHAWRR